MKKSYPDITNIPRHSCSSRNIDYVLETLYRECYIKEGFMKMNMVCTKVNPVKIL